MTSQEAASIIAMFHGAYPRTDIDDAVTEVWMNTLTMLDPDTAYSAAEIWINEKQFWPTIAEFNNLIRNVRQKNALPRPSAIHCDGSGWFDRGRGWEACPSCNPWNKQLIDNGQWNDLTVRPPSNWVQPPACKPVHTESDVFTFDQAREAVKAGYVEYHVEQGADVEAIQMRIDRISALFKPLAESA